MGKRNKFSNANAGDEDSNVKQKQSNKKRKLQEISSDVNVTNELDADKIKPLRSKKIKNTKLTCKAETERKKTIEPHGEMTSIPSKKMKSKNANVSQNNEIIVEDKSREKPKITDNVEKNKTKKNFNDDEAQVKDEDIDRFCDELDEEDNAQYESWVKLIEDNLNSKRKKL